jgi:hypothetical protein
MYLWPFSKGVINCGKFRQEKSGNHGKRTFKDNYFISPWLLSNKLVIFLLGRISGNHFLNREEYVGR